MASQSDEIERQLQIAGWVLIFLKYVPVIIGVLASISIALGAFNLVYGDYGWAAVNLGLGLFGMVFVSKIIMDHL
jgi:hypothetical protein